MSLETAKELSERGCNIFKSDTYKRPIPFKKAEYQYSDLFSPLNYVWWSEIDYNNDPELMMENNVNWYDPDEDCTVNYIPTYDLAEIATSPEMAKAFFGENSYKKNGDVKRYNVYFSHTTELKNSLLNNKKAEAEKYLLKHCLFQKTS